MDEITKQETRTDVADVQATKLDLNKDTLQDMDPPADEKVNGGAVGTTTFSTILCSLRCGTGTIYTG